jgi:hypothetical protein
MATVVADSGSRAERLACGHCLLDLVAKDGSGMEQVWLGNGVPDRFLFGHALCIPLPMSLEDSSSEMRTRPSILPVER